MAGRPLFLTTLTVTFLAIPAVARAPLSYAEGEVDPWDAPAAAEDTATRAPLQPMSWSPESIRRPERRRSLARSIAGTPAVISGPRPGLVDHR